jgi:hypothetical protein
MQSYNNKLRRIFPNSLRAVSGAVNFCHNVLYLCPGIYNCSRVFVFNTIQSVMGGQQCATTKPFITHFVHTQTHTYSFYV